MLLGDDVLRATIAAVWRRRERVEREAAQVFADLAVELGAAGFPAALVRLAEEAARDEEEHAGRCRHIVDAHHPGLPPLGRRPPVRLGAHELCPRERLLYTAVAVSCVTETLSVSLLGALRGVATDPLIAETIHAILQDEVAHARLGWAVVATEARRTSLAWLTPHLAAMVRAARAEARDEAPATPAAPAPPELSRYGVLPRPQAIAIMDATVDEVIVPGLRSFGIGLPA